MTPETNIRPHEENKVWYDARMAKLKTPNPHVKEYQQKLGKLVLKDPPELGWQVPFEPIEPPDIAA